MRLKAEYPTPRAIWLLLGPTVSKPTLALVTVLLYKECRARRALQSSDVSRAIDVSPVDLPLRLDDAGVSQPTSGYDRLSAQTERDLASLNTPKGTSLAGCGVVCCIGRPMRVSPYSRS
jgi:hypothetical protein